MVFKYTMPNMWEWHWKGSRKFVKVPSRSLHKFCLDRKFQALKF